MKVETGTIHLEVVNTGRLAATVKRAEVRDHFVLRTSQGMTTPILRWAVEIYQSDQRPDLPALPQQSLSLPQDIPPSGYLDFNIDVKHVLAQAKGSPEVTITGWAQRGDGKWSHSKPIRLR